MNDGKCILVKGTAGLGNRMLCALTGILYGLLARRRVIVDWTDPMFSDDGANVFGRFFECPAVEQQHTMPDTDSVNPRAWAGNLRMTAMQLVQAKYPERLGQYSSFKVTSIDPGRLDYDEEVVVLWSWDAQIRALRRHYVGPFAEFAPLTDWEVLRRLARQHLIPRDEIRRRVDEFRAARFVRPVVGVHVRHTDRRSPLERFHRRVRAILRTEPNASVFLATDNEAVNREFAARYENVLTLDKEFCEGGGAIHLDLASGRRTERAVEALTEMYLLAACDRLIYARRSTFSYVAHLISGLPDTMVSDLDRFSIRWRLQGLIRQGWR